MKWSKRAWMIGIVLAAAVFAAVMILHRPAEGTMDVLVTVDGAEYRRVPFDEKTDETLTVETPWGHNTVIIRDGAVDVVEADCPTQVCVNTVPARQTGDMIVCLPHRMVVEIVPGEAP